jgi:amino acid transporter
MESNYNLGQMAELRARATDPDIPFTLEGILLKIADFGVTQEEGLHDPDLMGGAWSHSGARMTWDLWSKGRIVQPLLARLRLEVLAGGDLSAAMMERLRVVLAWSFDTADLYLAQNTAILAAEYGLDAAEQGQLLRWFSGLEPPQALDRGMGLLQATATNIISMVGVGPFLTIPFMVAAMNGPHIIYAWLAGLVLALSDGLVYAQLGAALPGSGGGYLYLKEAFKPFGLGRLMAFLFIFQVILVAPLSVAGGAVGFADYMKFLWTGMTPVDHHMVAAAVCVVMAALLWRNIKQVGRLAVVMLVFVLITLGWVIVSGLFAFSPARAFDFPAAAFAFDRRLVLGLGATSLLAMYSYGGYNQVCNIGGEIKDPSRTIPRSIVLSTILVAVLYILMSTVILGMIPWQEVMESRTVASLFIQRTFVDPAAGRVAGSVMTGLILFVAAASLYATILGYSRIPYAAAKDGNFFKAFARVHPTKHFPDLSLAMIAALSIPFCFFTLGQIVSWLIQVQVLLCFIWQCAAVVLIRRYRSDIPQSFTMWLYPWPAVLSGALWLFIFFTGPWEGIVFSVAFLLAGVASYFVWVSFWGSGVQG